MDLILVYSVCHLKTMHENTVKYSDVQINAVMILRN